MTRQAHRAPAIDWILAVTLLAAGVAAWPLLSQNGLLNTRGGGDSPFLLQRTHQLVTALGDGHFPVRWMPDANYGYGYPFFNFYAPLSIYLAGIGRILGLNWTQAIQAAQLAGFLTAAAGAYLLGRRWLGTRSAGFLAGVAYTVAPFHLVNVYVRGDSLAEFWAMAWYPWLLLAVDAALAGRRHGTLLLAAAYAALALSHNISFVIFSPFVALWVAVQLALRRAAWRDAGRVALGLALGLALSAWFWLPAFVEQGLAQLGPVTEGYFHYSNHFRGRDLVQRSWLFDYGVNAGQAFRMGLVQALALVPGALVLAIRRRPGVERTVRVFVLLGLGLATLLVTPASRLVWETVPLLPFTQFPWRLLSVQAVLGATATAALVGDGSPLRSAAARAATAAVIGALLLAAALGALRPDFLKVTDADISAEALAQYEWFTGNIGTTISAEYLPPGVRPKPETSPWLTTGSRHDAVVVSGRAELTLLSARTGAQTWRVRAAEPATVLLPTLMWPGWRATLTDAAGVDQPVALRAAASSGLMLANVPAGEFTLALRLGRTPVRLAAEWMSLLALVGLIGAAAWAQRDRPAAALRSAGRATAWAAGSAAALALAAWLVPSPQPPAAAPATWDFAQMGYLAPAPGGVPFAGGGPSAGGVPSAGGPFADGGTLDGYAYAADSARAGTTWSLTLAWSGPARAARLALATPAVHRGSAENPVPLLADQRLTLRPGTQTVTFDLPPTLPAGLLVPRLTLDDGAPLTPRGAVRGDLFLRPLRVLPAADSTAALPLPLQVRLVDVAERPDGLDVALAWRTARPLTANYKASLRLYDSRNLFYMSYSGQPGYGFLPTSGWAAETWVHDRLALAWLADDGVGPYTLVASLFDDATGEVVLTRRLAQLSWADGGLTVTPTAPQFDPPDDVVPASATFGGGVALHGSRVTQDAATAQVTLVWQALGTVAADYRHFVHLVDADGVTVRQHDGIPQFGSYPTTQWTPGEYVADPAPLDLTDLPPGRYRVRVGLYTLEDGVPRRAPAVDADGRPLVDDALFLDTVIAIAP